MSNAKRVREPRLNYYLNDYLVGPDRLRIESKRGGDRCLWHEKASLTAMQTTKRYLEKTWKIS